MILRETSNMHTIIVYIEKQPLKTKDPLNVGFHFISPVWGVIGFIVSHRREPTETDGYWRMMPANRNHHGSCDCFGVNFRFQASITMSPKKTVTHTHMQNKYKKQRRQDRRVIKQNTEMWLWHEEFCKPCYTVFLHELRDWRLLTPFLWSVTCT